MSTVWLNHIIDADTDVELRMACGMVSGYSRLRHGFAAHACGYAVFPNMSNIDQYVRIE